MTLYWITYLSIGAPIMACVTLRPPYSSEPDGLVRLLTLGDSETLSKVMAAFIVPLFACIIVVAWPVVLVVKAQDMWERRGEAKAAADPQVQHYFCRPRGAHKCSNS